MIVDLHIGTMSICIVTLSTSVVETPGSRVVHASSGDYSIPREFDRKDKSASDSREGESRWARISGCNAQASEYCHPPTIGRSNSQ